MLRFSRKRFFASWIFAFDVLVFIADDTILHGFVMFMNETSSKNCGSFSSSILDKFNYYYQFTIKQFVKWCEGNRPDPMVRRLQILSAWNHSMSVSMLWCLCVCVCVCVCARVCMGPDRRWGVYKLSQLAIRCSHQQSGCHSAHTQTRTRAQTHAHTDHICHWQGYYSLSCVFYDPPFFSSFWSIRFFSPMQNNEDVIAGTSERSNVICVNVVGTLEHIAA